MTKQARIERATIEQAMTAYPPVRLTVPATAGEIGGRPLRRGRAGDGRRRRVPRSIAAPTGSSRGSIVLVLLVAALLVAAASGIVLVGGSNAEPYILAFLAVLATVGVFSLFALACGILRVSGGAAANPLIKAVVDGAFDGIVVTDHDGRVVYANAAYLDLIDAADANDMRPVERAFIGDADASEAIYRLLKAAREGKRLEEEVRIAGLQGPAGALAAVQDPPARREPARRAAHGLVARRRHRRARAAGKCVSGAAACDRLSRSCAGRLLLGR